VLSFFASCLVLLATCVPRIEEIAGNAAQYEQLPPIHVSPSDWPWWRGPRGNGIAAPQNVPLTWSPTENIVWQTDVPGRGHSSPVTWGRRVFLTTADDELQVQSVLAYNRDTGKQLWETVANRGHFMAKSHRHNSHASATSACDGERLFSVFVHDGGLWVTATDFDGHILWQTNAGDYDALYGYGSSPAIWQSLVFVLGDNDQTGSFLAALHRKTGQIVWRIARPNIDTYATPVVAHLAGRDQLLVGGCGYLASYDPATGKELWKCTGPTTETTANTAVWSDDSVFVSGGYPKPYTLMAVKAGGSGDVTRANSLWKSISHMPYVPSPLYDEGLLYIVDDWGIASCLDAKSGKPVWVHRLDDDFSSSPVKCGNRIYAANEAGQVFVFESGRSFRLLATNDLGDGIMATPAICGNQILLRTTHKLFCIGNAGADSAK
jgi:outer membrane protein assembly factor BamB